MGSSVVVKGGLAVLRVLRSLAVSVALCVSLLAIPSSGEAWGSSGASSPWSASSTPTSDLNPVSAANPEMNLTNVSCPVAGWCVGVGSYVDTVGQQEGLLETLAGTVSASSLPLAQLGGPNPSAASQISLVQVFCPSQGWCVAVGSYLESGGDRQGLIATLSAGGWSALPAPVGGLNPASASNPFALLTDVSCPVSGSCTAVGRYQDASGGTEPLVESLSGGVWTPLAAPLTGLSPASAPTPNGSLTAVSCPQSGSCVAVGDYAAGNSIQPGLIETLSSGSWSASTAPTGGLNPPASSYQSVMLNDVSCPAQGTCVAVGSYDTSSYSQPLIEALSGGNWSASTAPQSSLNPPAEANDAGLRHVVCSSKAWCVTVGGYIAVNENWQGLIDTLANGTWTDITAPLNGLTPSASTSSPFTNLAGLSCSEEGSCVAVGTYQDSTPHVDALIENLSGGLWTATNAPLIGLSPAAGTVGDGLTSVSCPVSGSCVSVGNYFDSSGNTEGLVETQYSGTATTVTVASRANPSTAGSSVTYTATVSPTPDGGTISFYDYSSAITGCSNTPVDISTGQAVCTVVYPTSTYSSRGVATPHKITAAYSGDTTYAPAGPSAPVWESVVPITTSLSLRSSRNPIWAGSTVTFTATITPVPNGGTINFTDTGSALSACTNRAMNTTTGKATCTITETTAGTHQIAATYSGTTRYASADSTLTETVQTPPACPTGISHLASGEPWTVAAMTTVIDNRLCTGYWVVTRSGGLTAIGAARWLGDMSGHRLNAPMIGIAATADHRGYYLLGADGGIFSFGDARFYGSTGNLRLNAPVAAMAVTPHGGGYWLAASDGGIFSFGNATFWGSTGNLHLNKPVVGMSADNQTGGYWLVAADGGMFAFHAPFFGSMGGVALNQPVIGMTPQPDGRGYRLAARDGGVFDFGDATYYGSLPARGVQNPNITTMATSVDGNGYYLINGSGTVWAFGDAPNLGNA